MNPFSEKFYLRNNFFKMNDIPVAAEGLTLTVRKKKILQEVSFAAEKNKITVLLGKNGSGKTSLLRTLAGIRKFTDGKIRLFGVPINETGRTARAKTVAFMPQFLPQLHITVRELIAMGRSPYHGLSAKLTSTDKEKIAFAVSCTDAEKHLDEAICTLSGGERQLAFLAMTLSTDAEIILFDEPTASLDTEYRKKVYRLVKGLKEGGKTIIITLHNLDEAMTIADRVTVIDEGKIIFSDDKHAFLSSDVPEKVFSLRPTRLFDENGEETVVFK